MDLFPTHFDSNLELIVACDTSSYGIGVCILHKMPDGTNKPIIHASRTLLPTETNYSQIEKEALGIIFAITKFHRYLHCQHFVFQTDHKPLLTIFGSKKGLPTHTANRLQRWGAILLNYNFKFATWDVLLHKEEQAAKAAANNIMTKNFRLELEYKGTCRLHVTKSREDQPLQIPRRDSLRGRHIPAVPDKG